MVVQVCILGAKPEFCSSVLGAAVDQAGVECDGEGVFRMFKSEISVDLLALVRRNQSVCADEVNLRLGAEDVGHDASTVLVCVDFGEEPFCIMLAISRRLQ